MRPPKIFHADLSLVLITLIWGSTFIIVKKSLAQVSPILLIALRFGIAAVVTAAFMPGALIGISQMTLRRGLILAAVLLGGFVFQTLGLRGTTPPRSAFIAGLTVLLVPVLGYVIFRRSPKPRTLAGVALATVGLALLTLDTFSLKLRFGDFLTLISAVVFALHILFLGRYLPTSDYRQLVVLQMAGGALFCLLVLPMLETPFLVWDSTFAFYLFVTGVLATALAFYLQNKAQQFTTPNRTALVFSMVPFFAVLFAYLFLDRAITPKEWMGGGLVLIGILASELRRS